MKSDPLTNQLIVIKAELAIARNCLHDAVVAAAHGDFEQARQLIANSKRSYKTVLEQLSNSRPATTRAAPPPPLVSSREKLMS